MRNRRLNGEGCLIWAIISTAITVALGVVAFIYCYFNYLGLTGLIILIATIIGGIVNFIMISTLAIMAMRVDELWEIYYKEEINEEE